jgi:hypothetical protein
MAVNETNKIAIADYKWKYLLYAVVCWGLVLAGFLAIGAKERHWQFWMAEVVMVTFALGITYMLLSKKYEFIGRKGPRFDAYLDAKYNDMLTKSGRFLYTEDGFVFHGDGNEIPIQWSEISKISAHLEDVVTNDQDLCLRMEYGENHFLEFDEEIEGWILFKQKLAEKFQLPGGWEQKLIDSNQKELVLYPES